MCTRRFFLVFLFTAVVLTASGDALADKYRVGNEIQISHDDPGYLGNYYEASIAYNLHQKEYLVVESWRNRYTGQRHISASRVSPNGSRTHLGIVSSGSDSDFVSEPDVAYDPQNGRYLIVWEHYNGVISRYEIYGRIIPWNSLGTNEPFLVATLGWADLHLKKPAVAFGYNHLTGSYRYMVAWQNVSISSGVPEGICQNLVSVDGSPLTPPSYIDPGPNAGFPDITFNVATAQFLVVWEAPGGSSGIDIFGRRLGLGGLTQGSTFPINSAPHDDRLPAVTTNTQHRYLVVWQHDSSRGSFST